MVCFYVNGSKIKTQEPLLQQQLVFGMDYRITGIKTIAVCKWIKK